ncbi:MAG: cbb3-type cytochrome c oxidase subunit I [Chthoniobacterales bacterium]|jgi:cytochrome c oxidase subunit 1|nr:cbb3-type cytochrome c oxidase subunit I [Chthoniobacterales bacterium]
MSASLTHESGASVEIHGENHHGDHGHGKHGIMHYLWNTDHKMIALQFLWSATLFLVLGGAMAIAMRWQLAFPGHPVPIIGHLLPHGIVNDDGAIIPSGYNVLVTMHGTILVFFVAMPLLIGVFGNFLIPLKIGAGDMAFPALNELSYWLFALSGVVMMASFWVPGGAPGTGWTAYAPLSSFAPYNQTPMGQTFWCTALFLNGLSSITGAVNYITTVITMRAPGMTMFRMPLPVWAIFLTAILLILAIPVLSAAAALIIFDLNFGTTFFKPSGYGQPLLWQHLFWFFGHPEVYILILPAMGLTSEILSVFSRKPVFGYKAMVWAMISIGFLGFIVWGHHMYVSGMNLTLSAAFSVSTMVIAVPSAIKTFNWMGTIWRGSIHYTVPMAFAVSFVSMFVIGGLSGIFMASTPVDLFVHHTYFIVAHFHYVLFGGSMFAIFAAVYFWFPKMSGRMFNNTLGWIHFWMTLVFFNLTFFPMHNLGLGGMMRRIADPTVYDCLRQLQPLNVVCTIGAMGLGLGTIPFIVNIVWSMFNGPKAPANPWNSTTLEWTVSHPIPHGNFSVIPTVYHGPYEYSVPGLEKDYLPQNEKAPAHITLEAH